MIMLQHGAQPLVIIPADVEGGEDMRQLLGVESVEVGDDGVQLEDHVVFGGGVERSVVDADGGRPLGVAFVDGGEAAREGDDPLPEPMLN